MSVKLHNTQISKKYGYYTIENIMYDVLKHIFENIIIKDVYNIIHSYLSDKYVIYYINTPYNNFIWSSELPFAIAQCNQEFEFHYQIDTIVCSFQHRQILNTDITYFFDIIEGELLYINAYIFFNEFIRIHGDINNNKNVFFDVNCKSKCTHSENIFVYEHYDNDTIISKYYMKVNDEQKHNIKILIEIMKKLNN